MFAVAAYCKRPDSLVIKINSKRVVLDGMFRLRNTDLESRGLVTLLVFEGMIDLYVRRSQNRVE